MKAIDLLLGNIPPEEKERQRLQKRRLYQREWREKNKKKLQGYQKKRVERYKTDPEYREAMRRKSREHREAHLEESRRKEAERNRKRLANMTTKEYLAERERRNAICRASYHRKKMKLIANSEGIDGVQTAGG